VAQQIIEVCLIKKHYSNLTNVSVLFFPYPEIDKVILDIPHEERKEVKSLKALFA